LTAGHDNKDRIAGIGQPGLDSQKKGLLEEHNHDEEDNQDINL
jgi:hypothetical protein